MLTMRQITKSITDMIISSFPGIGVQSSDVKEGFKRPSFFAEIVNVGSDTKQFVVDRSMTARIYYFPESRHDYSLEIMDMVDGLDSTFNLSMVVVDRVVTINETRSQTIDGVLEFEFDFEFTDSIQTDNDDDLMEDLELNV